MRPIRSFVCALAAAFALVALMVVPAFAQASPSASASVKVAPPGPPATYYAAYGLIGIAGLTVLAFVAGYLVQAPGFRHKTSGRTAVGGGE